jgi:hypothetical protein
MKPSIKAIALTSALMWGGCMLVVGLINLADASYGSQFLRIMSSVYPGADATRTLGCVLLGAVYGFIDGGLFVWLYRMMTRRPPILH